MRFVFIFFLFCFASLVEAHVPVVVSPASYSDVTVIEQPNLSHAYYGELKDFPHTYEFTLSEPKTLLVQVLVPDIAGVENNRSAIIVRKVKRGVEEVAHLQYNVGVWNTFYEPFGGDSYRNGPSFEREVEAGTYIIEVSTPSNMGKYVLVVGKIEDFSNMSYFDTVARIYAVKKFFNKPDIAIFQSPFVYVPTVVLLLLGFVGYRVYRKKYA